MFSLNEQFLLSLFYHAHRERRPPHIVTCRHSSSTVLNHFCYFVVSVGMLQHTFMLFLTSQATVPNSATALIRS